MKKNIILFLLGLLYLGLKDGKAQNLYVRDSLINRFVHQIQVYPQDKVYLHIDKGSYLVGDTVWLRAYLVDATLHIPVNTHKYIYAELVNPMDSIVSQAIIRLENNIYSGYLSLGPDLPGGNYTLRAYTRYMLNNNRECMFTRPIHLLNPLWNRLQMNTSVSIVGKRSSLNLAFTRPSQSFSIQQANLLLDEKENIPLKLPGKESSVIKIEWDKIDWRKSTSWLLAFKDNENNSYSHFFPSSIQNIDYEVTFYPEGGYLLNDVSCRVAFKALDKSGNATEINMDIIDETGQVLTTTRTLHDGMGSFSFVPELGKSYKARCSDQFGLIKTFSLPNTEIKALHGLRIDVQRDHFKVSLLSVPNISPESLFLIAHVRGMVVFSEEWKEQEKAYLIPKSYFPAGVVQFLLFDKSGHVLSERLSFSDTYSPVSCEVTTDASIAKKRELVTVNLDLKDSEEQPLKGNYSVSVVDSKFFPVDSCFHIQSYLLLTSELKGTISSPGSYFKKGDARTRNRLDLLMLTQGWRRYNLPNIIIGNYIYPVLEKHSDMAICGQTITSSGLLGKADNQHLVSIMGVGKANGFKRVIPTDKEGYFCVDSIEYADGSGFYVEAMQLKGKKTEKIDLFSRKYPLGFPLFPQEPFKNDSLMDSQVEIVSDITRLDNLHFLLRDVEIKAPMWGSRDYRHVADRDVVRHKDMRTMLKSLGLSISTMAEEYEGEEKQTSVNTMDDNIETDTTDLSLEAFSAIEGTLEREGIVNEMIYCDGKRILLFVDDNYCKPDVLVNWITPGDIENLSLIKEVDRQQANALLKGALKWSEMYYADRTFDLCYAYSRIPRNDSKVTILNVTTKNGFDSRCLGWWSKYYQDIKQYNQQKTTVYPLGYQLPVEFYAPKYDNMAKKSEEVPDLRTTLFWTPRIVSDEQGKASFSFYTSDQPGNYFITVEGISDKGEIVHVVKPLICK